MKSEQQPRVVGGREGVVKTGRSRRVDKIFRAEGEGEGEKTHRRPLPCPPSCVFFLPEEKTTAALEVFARKRKKMLDEQILQLLEFSKLRGRPNRE